MNRYVPVLLSLLSGLLLFTAWPQWNITAALFVALIPLFILTDTIRSGYRYFLLLYLALFTWNVSTTWWIWNSTMIGAWLAIIVNSLLMCLPWLGFRLLKKSAGDLTGYASLIVFWLSFEYLHQLDWGLSWPWLTIGNAFAGRTEWVQWFEYTGTSGGTLWVLLVNVLLYQFFFRTPATGISQKGWILRTGIPGLVLLAPIVLSYLVLQSREQAQTQSQQQDGNVVVIQPNIDPYEKVATGTFEAQLQKLIRLSETAVDSNTTLLVWPETALYSPNGFDEQNLKTNFFLNPLFDFLRRHPNLNLFTGIESYRVFPEKVSLYARPIDGTSQFYEVYNGSVLLDSSGARQFYHKSMLVPGVETLPRFLLFLGPVFEKFGGTTGGYARQAHRTPVPTSNHYKLAPAICYESIYGEYMSRYIANGANLIAIITNDGWWGNTPGHHQHMAYARLRAIETRRWVVRSANTGISCFVDPLGNVLQPQPWWTEAAIQQQIPVSNGSTWFVRFGDVLSKLALMLAAGFLLLGIFIRYNKTYRQKV